MRRPLLFCIVECATPRLLLRGMSSTDAAGPPSGCGVHSGVTNTAPPATTTAPPVVGRDTPRRPLWSAADSAEPDAARVAAHRPVRAAGPDAAQVAAGRAGSKNNHRVVLWRPPRHGGLARHDTKLPSCLKGRAA
jgi:hypothetical protein